MKTMTAKYPGTCDAQEHYNATFPHHVDAEEKCLRALGPKGLKAAGIRRSEITAAAINAAKQLVAREWRAMERAK